MIELGKITYAYGNNAVLRDVSLKVANGKIYGIFGKEGVGKGTLLSLMAGARELQTGVVRINGFDLQKEPIKAKRCLGYCPRNAVFYPDMTVYELLDFAASVNGVREDRRFIRIHEWMEQYGLDGARNHRIGGLAPMELFRLKLVQALVGEAEILLLDSPMDGLSKSDAESALEMIRELKEKGKTVFLATASANEVAALADEIWILKDGELTAAESVSECFDEEPLTAEETEKEGDEI